MFCAICMLFSQFDMLNLDMEKLERLITKEKGQNKVMHNNCQAASKPGVDTNEGTTHIHLNEHRLYNDWNW